MEDHKLLIPLFLLPSDEITGMCYQAWFCVVVLGMKPWASNSFKKKRHTIN